MRDRGKHGIGLKGYAYLLTKLLRGELVGKLVWHQLIGKRHMLTLDVESRSVALCEWTGKSIVIGSEGKMIV